MKTGLLALTLWFGVAGVSAQESSDPVSEVLPFVGTATNSLHDNGNTIPGAVRPFGLLYWSPDPVDGPHYMREHPFTRGFSLTHLSGEGCGIFGDVPVLPILGPPRDSPGLRATVYQASYRPEDEKAEPGFYQTTLDSGIRVALAAQVHSGLAEFTFPAGNSQHTLLADLSRNLNKVLDTQVTVHGREISGSVTGGHFCGMENQYKLYFLLEAGQDPASFGTSDPLGVYPGRSTAAGTGTSAYLSFPASTKTVQMKAAISYVSLENARANLKQEIPGWQIADVRRKASAAWRDVLSRVQIRGGAPAEKEIFYTGLYHALIQPSTFSDVNGEYMGFDKQVHRLAGGHILYANFSGWDIYRSQVQLLAMLYPEVAGDVAQSLVLAAQEGGGLPKWTAANDESSVMVGDPSSPILASIYAFGAHDFDAKSALAAMVRGASDPSVHLGLYRERPELPVYQQRGYVTRRPNEAERKTTGDGSASVTLEYQTADFSVAQMAAMLGDHKTQATFLKRSGDWRKIFDPEARYIRPRDWAGNFLPDFTPGKPDGFVEGNSAQYTWMVPYDLRAIIEAIGGNQAANERLDVYFSKYGYGEPDGSYVPFFYLSNEPSFAHPWIYNWTGRPWRTQEVVRKTIKDLFTTGSDGLPGNDDLGATSAWLVFAQLGFYPAIPGVGGVTFHTPAFPDVTLKLKSGTLHILAHGAPANGYVSNISIDGSPVRNWWADWETLAKAKQLKYTLSPKPVTEPSSAEPPSFPPDR